MGNVPNAGGFSLAVGNQSAEGAAAATYLFDLPIWGGNITPKETQNPFEASDTSNFRPGYYATEAWWEASGLQVGAFPTSLPFLFDLLFGTDTVGGAAPANTHTITAANPNTLFGTFWLKRPTFSPTTLTDAFVDGTVNAIELVVAAGQPLKVNLDVMGKTVTTAATYPSAIASAAGSGFAGLAETYSSRNAVQTVTGVTSTQSTNTVTLTKTAHPFLVGDIITVSGATAGAAIQNGTFVVLTVPTANTLTYSCPSSGSTAGSAMTVSSNNFLSAIGSTLKMDAATSPAASAVTNVISASIKVMRATQQDQTTAYTPTFRTQGLFTLSFSATVEIDAQAAFNFYRVARFGGAAGTTLSPLVLDGGLDFSFVEAPVAGGNLFQIKVPAIVYDVEPHAFDPQFGPARLNITGMVDKFTGAGGSIQVIGTNGVGAYPAS